LLELVKQDPELAAVRKSTYIYIRPRILRCHAHPGNYASTPAFEIRRGPPPEDRDFLRIKFKHGTNDNFQTYHAFSHKADIPVTEFIYKIEVSSSVTGLPALHSLTSPCTAELPPSLHRGNGPPPASAPLATTTHTSTSAPKVPTQPSSLLALPNDTQHPNDNDIVVPIYTRHPDTVTAYRVHVLVLNKILFFDPFDVHSS
jgi:hypothetical protein